ncbi:MAG: hypothetical protein ABR563_12945 [Pyrinomonadaceae bacterium]
MRKKLIANALLTAAVTFAPAVGVAQQVGVERRVEVRPEVKVDLGRIAPVAIPGIRVDFPDIEVPIPPLPPIPPIDIDIPDLNINVFGDDIWFGEEQTEREELRQSYQLSPGARVELANIDGSVVVDTTDSQTAQVVIKSYSYSDNPRKLAVEQTGSSLTIRGPERKEHADFDNGDGTRHSLRLTLPRRTNLVLTNVRDSVRVGELEGSLKADHVSGHVAVAQAAGSAEISDVAGSVTATLTRLAGRGVSVSNVVGRVSLRFLEDVNAQLQTSGIKGKVYVELPNVAVEGEMASANFRAKIGAGGAPVSVSDVTGTVRLSRGQPVAEMLNVLKTSDRNAARSQVAADLALHVSNPQVRAAFVEALGTDQNTTVLLTASRELVPYADEPEVRDAYLRLLESGRNDSARMTAAAALARKYAGDAAVRERLLRVLAAEKKDAIRATIVGALSKQVDDGAVERAFVNALRTDEKQLVRARAARALAAKIADADVYDAELSAARNDERRLVRAVALDALSRRIRDRAELRELFTGYLDDESQTMQYHALKGLVELNDPALKPRLVEKARQIILMNYRRNWNDRTVLAALLLLRKLDPQEADRMLEQLSAERAITS